VAHAWYNLRAGAPGPEDCSLRELLNPKVIATCWIFAMSANNRATKRQAISVDGMIYDQHGKSIAPCTLRNVSAGGAQLELEQEVDLPRTFMLALSRDGHVRRNCTKVWQFATVAGVRFDGTASH
jgi:hypothetical protein